MKLLLTHIFKPTLCLVFFCAWAVQARAVTTQTFSPTIALTGTPTRTQTFFPTPTRTATPSRTTSATATTTALISQTFSPTISATLTLSPTPVTTWTQTPTPVGTSTPYAIVAPLIEDFPGGIDPGQSRTTLEFSSNDIVSDSPGCPCGTLAHALRISGVAGTSFNGPNFGSFENGVVFDQNGDYTAVAKSSRTLSFRVKANTLPTGRIVVLLSGLSLWGAYVPVTQGAWVNVTVALPDHANPGSLPQMVFGQGVPESWDTALTHFNSLGIGAEGDAVSTLPFDLEIDDVAFGAYPLNNSCGASAALGVPVGTLDEAYGTGLDDQGAWLLAKLAAHCGLTPKQVLALRATQSWGQISAGCGIAWAALVDETDLAIEAAGLVPETGLPGDWETNMTNGPPNLSPLPTPTPYPSPGPVLLPTPGVCP